MMHLEGFRQYGNNHGPCPACLVNVYVRRSPDISMTKDATAVTCKRCLRINRKTTENFRALCPGCGEPAHANVCEVTRSRNVEIAKLRTLLTKAHYTLQDPHAARSYDSALCAEIRAALGVA